MLANLNFSRLNDLKVVVLTGAGISAESGIRTFRDNDGLWEGHKVEEVATPEGFNQNSALVYDFYNQRRRQLLHPSIQPNDAHLGLAKLESILGKNLTLITQNVDNLHQQAGSKNVLHMHGNLLSARCLVSGKSTVHIKDLDQIDRCQCCHIPSQMRPDIVWFGEMPKYMEIIENALQQTDLFVSIGTSGTVYPAAGFVNQANLYGAYSLELNLEPSLGHSAFKEKHCGLASELVNQMVDALILGNTA